MTMRRRTFIGLLGAAAWPLGARAQQLEKVRRVGYLTPAHSIPQLIAGWMQAPCSRMEHNSLTWFGAQLDTWTRF